MFTIASTASKRTLISKVIKRGLKTIISLCDTISSFSGPQFYEYFRRLLRLQLGQLGAKIRIVYHVSVRTFNFYFINGGDYHCTGV